MSAASDARSGDVAVGERRELARYRVRVGERVVVGQRINGIVRFLPDDLVVLVLGRAQSEDSSGRSRGRESRGGRADAVRPKRTNVTDDRGRAADTCLEGRS